MSIRSAALIALALTFTLTFPALPASAKGRHRFDANGDGKISLPEFLALRGRIFDHIDANHDGQITKEEVAAFQLRMETAAAGAMIRSGKERAEGGGQARRLGELTQNGPLSRARWDAMLTKRFQRMDTDGVGYITMDQMLAGRRSAEETGAVRPKPAEPPKS